MASDDLDGKEGSSPAHEHVGVLRSEATTDEPDPALLEAIAQRIDAERASTGQTVRQGEDADDEPRAHAAEACADDAPREQDSAELSPTELPQPAAIDEALAVLPDDIKEVVCASAKVAQVTISMSLVGVLALMSLAAQCAANVVIHGRSVPLSLFALAAACTGERKSTLLNLLFGKIKGLAGKYPTMLYSDVTLEGLLKGLPKASLALGLIATEGARFFGQRMKQTLPYMAGLTELWDGKTPDLTRAVITYNRVASPEVRATMLVMFQPETLRQCLSNDAFYSQGFGPRLLPVVAEPLAGTRSLAPALPEERAIIDRVVDRAWAMVEAYQRGDVQRLDLRSIPLTAEAENLYAADWQAIERALPHLDERSAAIWDRSRDHSLRLGGILACFAGVDTVTVEHMTAGLVLSRFFVGQHSELLDLLGMRGAEETHLQKLAAYVKRATAGKQDPVISIAQITKCGPRPRNVAVLRPWLETLCDRGELERVPDATGEWFRFVDKA